MPLEDIAGDMLKGALRVISRAALEVIFELAIKGVGYALIKLFRPHSEPSDNACTWVGLVFWATAIALAIFIYPYLSSA